MAAGVGLAALALLAGEIGAVGHASATSGGGDPSGNLTVVTEGLVWPSLDPANPTITPAEAMNIPSLQPLFYSNNRDQLVPMLATGYKVSPDGLTFTITLRKGVKFQDGTPFNAAAVVYNLKRYQDPSGSSECVPYLQVVKSVEATGPYTVTINLTQKDAALMPVLGSLQCSQMVSPAAVAKEGTARFGRDPVGTGPYELVSDEQGVEAKYKYWSGYWGKIQHPLSTITIENVASAQDAYDAIEAGTAQAWIDLNDAGITTQVRQAESNSSLTVLKGAAPSINYVTMSFKSPPFNNLTARRALMYATNPAAIVQKLYGGLYTTVEGVFAPSLFTYSGKLKGYPVDNLAKAKELVKQLGGLSFSLDLSDTPGNLAEAEALQAQWSQAGIKATLVPLQTPELIKALHALNYQGLLIVSPTGLTDPDSVAYRWFYSKSSLTQNGLSNPQVDKLVLEGRSTYDRAKRIPIYREFNQLVGAELDPWDNVFAQPFFQIQTKAVKGWGAFTSEYVPWNTVSLAG